MSCDKLGELSLEAAIKLTPNDPDRTDLLQLPAKFHCECRVTQQTHTSKTLHGPKPPLNTDEIPDFLRKVPKAKELFVRHHILEEVLS
jgi:hypothetical protein